MKQPEEGKKGNGDDVPLARELLADYGIFRVLQKRGTLPRTGKPVVYHTLELPDWVQIIPRTPSGQLIMVEQLRPGAEICTLEFPAGLLDEGEDPLHAGLRELEEETGYRAAGAWHVGSVFVNPAIQSNQLHFIYAQDCRPDGNTQLDEGEDIQTRLVAEADLPELIRNGTIEHALVLTAWQLYELWRVQRAASRT
jgi:8-oxo-dGTP pyrophosphatase MutT (NUDIX family)